MIIKTLLAVFILIVVYFSAISFLTRQHTLKKETERELLPCPNTPNCILSISSDEDKFVKPFNISNENPDANWNALVKAIQEHNGELLVNDGSYLHAVFTSNIFRFKDDLEATLSKDHIDIRSASRAGKSDLGQNKKRINHIRSTYQANLVK